MALQRTDLFGYAGSSHQPQGRVLTAEEAYGALGSESLAAEEEYGYDPDDEYGALGSESLTAEEEYGLDDEDDDFGFDDDDEYGALGSESLTAEEEYGLDDEDDEDDEMGAWYGEDDEDDEDDEMGFFGAEEGEAAAMLDELDAEMDEEIYGAWYGAAGGTLAVPAGTEQALNALGAAVNAPGVLLPSFLQSAGAEPGWVEWGLEKMASWIAPGDAEELAAYLMKQPQFHNWNSLGPAQQAELVRNAVWQSAIPGLEQNWDEPFRQAWNSSPSAIGAAWAGLKATPSAVWAFITSDAPNGVVAFLTEIPGFGAGLQAAMNAAGVQRPDQLVNGLAMRYYVMGLVGIPVYSWIADAVTRQGQAAVQAVQAVSMPVGPQDLGVLPVMPPPQALPAPTTGLPAPQTILALGYAAMAGGAVLGVFK